MPTKKRKGNIMYRKYNAKNETNENDDENIICYSYGLYENISKSSGYGVDDIWEIVKEFGDGDEEW